MTVPAPAMASRRARLRLIATTDLHMHLTAYDYFSEKPTSGGALTRLATLARAARSEARARGDAVLLLDNGDGMQGTPMGDMAAGVTDRPHPLMRAFELMGYDAIGLGNHDFNFGIEALEAALSHAPCPVLSSNLRRLEPALLPTVADDVVFDFDLPGSGVLRVGVLSFLPPQTVRWDAHLLQGRIRVDDILCSAKASVARLRQKGCDLIVALAHSGLGSAEARPDMENAVIPLAGLDGIDAVIAGHTHLNLPGDDHTGLTETDAQTGAIHGKPAMMPGSAGSHLGVADIDLERLGDGPWKVAGFRTELRPVSRIGPDGGAVSLIPEDPELRAALAPDQSATIASLRRPAGHTKQPLHTFFSLISADHALTQLAASQAAALRPLLAGTAAEGLPVLSAVAPAKCGGRAGPGFYSNVPAGALSKRHISDLCPFPNYLRAVILSGQHLLDWLEMSASLFHQIAPESRGSPLTDPDLPAHNFDVLYGLNYAIDLSQPARYLASGEERRDAGSRISSVTWNARPLDPGQRFVIATNNYRVAGGGDFAALQGAEQVALPNIPLGDVLRRYLTGDLARDPLEDASVVWRFAPVRGANAIALTGPQATDHLSELSGRDIVTDGLDAQGFLRLLLPLDPG